MSLDDSSINYDSLLGDENNLTEKQELELRFLLDLRKKQARRCEVVERKGKVGKKSSEEGLGLDLKRTKQSTGREEERPARATSIMVTSTALTFILLAATLVTFTFLMSPVIEEMFGDGYFR